MNHDISIPVAETLPAASNRPLLIFHPGRSNRGVGYHWEADQEWEASSYGHANLPNIKGPASWAVGAKTSIREERA